MRWRLLIRPVPIMFGIMAGLGGAILMQQYAVTVLTPGLLVGMAFAGAAFYGVIPTVILNLILMRDVQPPSGVEAYVRASGIGWVLLGATALLVLAVPGDATVEGPCTGTINGQAITDEVVTVPQNGTVAYRFDAQSPPRAWSVDLEYAGASVGVDEGASDTDERSATGMANVNDYAWMGVGLYELEGTILLADGSTCTGSVIIKVDGNPLTTVLGGAAAGAAVVGVGGGAVATGLGVKSALAAARP